MLYIQERRKSLLYDAEEMYKEQFKTRIREIEERYRQNECRKSVIKAFIQVANKWGNNYNKPAASLGICSLYSSISMRTYEYRLVLSGEEFLFDNEAIEAVWIPDYFCSDFEKDMQYIIKQLKNTYPRLCSNEEEAIRFQCAEYLHAAVYKLCADMIKEILDEEAFIQLRKTDNFFVYFGRYKGEGEIIGRAGMDAVSNEKENGMGSAQYRD